MVLIILRLSLLSSAIPALAAPGPIFEKPPDSSGNPPQLRPFAPSSPKTEFPGASSATPATTTYLLKVDKTVNLTLKAAFDQAEQHNPEILKARQDVEIASAGIVSAGAIPNPQLAVQTGFGPAWTKTIAGNTQQVGINQILETGGKRSARLQLNR